MAKFLTTTELARRLGVKRNTIVKRALRYDWPFEWTTNNRGGRTKLFDISKVPVEIPVKETKEDFFVLSSAEYPKSDVELLEQYRQQFRDRMARKTPGIIEVALKKFLPIGIACVGDQHLGRSCWVDRMIEDAEIVASTEGLYAVIGGDGIDNWIKHWSAVVTSVSRPSDELKAFRAYLKIFASKILMMVSGNHDAWSEDFAGTNLIRGLANELNILYSPNWRGVLKIHFVDDLELDEDGGFVNVEEPTSRPYTILVQHKSSWNSRLNPGHACQRTLERGDVDADVIAIGHNHVGAAFHFELHGKPRIGLRWSSYKVQDSFGVRHGYARSDIATCPAAVLYPKIRKMLAFADVRDAATFLTAERARISAESGG